MSENDSFKEVPIHMADVDINTPPAQDSPKNIVNILNDDCIQLVLLKLKNVNDFYSAAQVCTRFQANAKTCFRFEKVKFKYEVSCTDGRYIGGRRYVDFILFESAEEFLNLFGPRIKSIHCCLVPRPLSIGKMDHEENLRLISQYCGQTLTELEIEHIHPPKNLNLRSPYQVLKKLKLNQISFFNFNPSLMFPELQHLEMDGIFDDADWLANRFPMLQYAKIKGVTFMHNEMFIEFQNHNPQLQSLHLIRCVFLPSVWENIGDRLPNIVELGLDGIRWNITHFSTLRHLKKLYLNDNMCKIPNESKSFFSALVKNNQPIEELNIRGVDDELGKILQKLPTIKRLELSKGCDCLNCTTENIALDLVTHLPALEYFRLRDFFQRIHLRTVKKILQNCKNVREIDIQHELLLDGTTDFVEHDAIVALATGRVKLNFECVLYSEMEVTTEYKEMLKNQFRDRNNEWVCLSVVTSLSNYLG